MRMVCAAIVMLFTTIAAGEGAAQERALESPAAGTLIEPLVHRTLHVTARGDVALGAVSAGLAFFDLSKPAAPRVLSVVPLPQSATFVLCSDSTAYVAEGPAGVYAVDAASPSKASVFSHRDTPGSAMALDISNEVLAVADGSMGVALFDVRNASNPRALPPVVWTHGYCRSVKFLGPRIYACAAGSGIVVLKTDDSGRWRESSVCATAGDARDIAFVKSAAVVADGRWGVTILDLEDPDHPKVAATEPAMDFVRGVSSREEFVYAADGASGVGVFRIDGTRLEPCGRLDTEKGYANSVAVYGRLLLVANDAMGILVLDIADPGNPRFIEGDAQAPPAAEKETEQK